MRSRKKIAAVLVAILVISGSAIVADRVAENRRLDRILKDANSAIDRRDFSSATSRLNDYLASRPDDVSVRLLAARTARRQGDFAAARNHLRYHQRYNGAPEDRSREELLLTSQEEGTAHADSLIESCLSPSPPPDLDLVLEVAIEQQLKRIAHGLNTGKSLVDGPYGMALAQTDQAIAIWLERRPGLADQVQGLLWRGRLKLFTDQPDAIKDFRQATELNPDHFVAQFNLAAALMDTDVGEAARHLESLHGREPLNDHVTMLLAQARRSLGQSQAAVDLCDELIQREPYHAAALLERGKGALDLGRPTEAEPFLRRALEQAPEDPFVHLALSRCLLLTGKEPEARLQEEAYTQLQLKHLKSEEDFAKARREWQDKTDREKGSAGPGPPRR